MFNKGAVTMPKKPQPDEIDLTEQDGGNPDAVEQDEPGANEPDAPKPVEQPAKPGETPAEPNEAEAT
jgi:hypothetical protein